MDRIDLEPADRDSVPGTWAFGVSWSSRREWLGRSAQVPGTEERKEVLKQGLAT